MADILYLEEVSSSNDIARDYAQKGAPHMFCVWANSQTKGRGREGRVWQTYKDTSLALSFVVRDVHSPAQLSLITALAVHKAISTYIHCQIKWPNDILINNQKIAGILVEAYPETLKGGLYFIIGIGLNINKNENFESLGTTLEEAIKKTVDREEVLGYLIEYLQDLLPRNWEDLYPEYIKNCVTLGQPVCWKKGLSEEVFATAKSLSPDGTLLLENSDGTVFHVHSGDIILMNK